MVVKVAFYSNNNIFFYCPGLLPEALRFTWEIIEAKGYIVPLIILFYVLELVRCLSCRVSDYSDLVVYIFKGYGDSEWSYSQGKYENMPSHYPGRLLLKHGKQVLSSAGGS